MTNEQEIWMNEVKDKIRGYIVENFLFSEDKTLLVDDKSFIDSGILDSTGILEIVGFTEEEFGIKVEDDEMIPDNLDSVSRLVGFILRKTGKSDSLY